MTCYDGININILHIYPIREIKDKILQKTTSHPKRYRAGLFYPADNFKQTGYLCL